MASPVYRQLNTQLRQLIEIGEFKEGDKFLTERQVAERFNVSRITANKALANLVAEHRLEFRKGVGTFVARTVLDYNLRNLTSFTSLVESQGRKPSTRVLAFQFLEQGIAELHHLPCYFVERLRLADDLPVILERRYFLASLCPNLNPDDLSGSIYSLWRDRYFLQIAGAEQTIRAVNITGREADLLGVSQSSAALLNTSLGFLTLHNLFWFEQTLYRGDAYEFFNRIGYVEAPTAAVGRLI